MVHLAQSSAQAPGGSRQLRLGLVMFLAMALLAASLAPVLPSGRAFAQEAQGGTAAYVPETALLYANVELDQDSSQWQLAGELAARSGLADLIPAEDQEELEDSIGILGRFIDGEAGIVLATLPETGDFSLDSIGTDASGIATDPEAVSQGDVPEGWAIVLQPSDAEVAYDMLRDTVLGQDDDTAAVEPQTVEYEGYTIEFVEPVDEFGTGAAIALVDDVVVISTRPDDIEPIIDTATGAVAPLSELSGFTELRGRFEAEVLSFGFVNGPTILSSIEEQDAEALAEVPDDFIAALNAYSAFAFWADEPGFRLDTFAVPAEGEELPAAENFSPTFPENIDGNSLFYAGGTNLGENPGVNALALLLAQTLVGIDPGATPAAAQDPEAYADEIFAEAEATLGFNLKTDFLDQMVGEWGIAGSADELLSAEPTINGVFASNVDDAATVTDAVERITALVEGAAEGQVEISSRDVDGSTVTTLDLSDSGFSLVVEFGVVGDQFLIGVNEGIETFVTGPDSSLADNEIFQATLAELPGEFSAVSFVNLELAIPLVEETVGATTGASVADADPACGEFTSQEEAQAAYDEDNFENFALDQDFDGTACEDFFAADQATPEATPSISEAINVQSIGTVVYQADGASATSTIILIGE